MSVYRQKHSESRAGHLLTRKLSEVVIGRLSRESEQKELVGYSIQSREDHAE